MTWRCSRLKTPLEGAGVRENTVETSLHSLKPESVENRFAVSLFCEEYEELMQASQDVWPNFLAVLLGTEELSM